MVNFWETPEWIELKSKTATTDKILTRVEFVKAFGWVNYSDESYSKYLKAMAEKPKEINNDSIQELAD